VPGEPADETAGPPGTILRAAGETGRHVISRQVPAHLDLWGGLAGFFTHHRHRLARSAGDLVGRRGGDRPFHPGQAQLCRAHLGIQIEGRAKGQNRLVVAPPEFQGPAEVGLDVGQFGLVAGGEQKTLGRIGEPALLDADQAEQVLFGDGAGAIVLEAHNQPGTNDDQGILASRLRSDGRYEDLLYVDGGPSTTQSTGHLRMNGREVFRHAVQKISGVIEETLVATGYAADEIDLYVPHQANARILDGIAKKLGVSPDKIMMTLSRHGNTSAASIPLALAAAVEEHRVREGQLVLMEAMGGGFTWGAVLARW